MNERLTYRERVLYRLLGKRGRPRTKGVWTGFRMRRGQRDESRSRGGVRFNRLLRLWRRIDHWSSVTGDE